MAVTSAYVHNCYIKAGEKAALEQLWCAFRWADFRQLKRQSVGLLRLNRKGFNIQNNPVSYSNSSLSIQLLAPL